MKVPVPMVPGVSSGAAGAIAFVLVMGVTLFAMSNAGWLATPSPAQPQRRQ